MACSSHKLHRIVILVDLTSPGVGDSKRESINALVEISGDIYGKPYCKLVIALSSSVNVSTRLAAREATTLIDILLEFMSFIALPPDRFGRWYRKELKWTVLSCLL